MFLQVWLSVVQQVLREAQQKYRESQQHEYSSHKPRLKLVLSMLIIEFINQQGQEHQEDY